MKHEKVGIESAVVSTRSLNLTAEGMTEFQQALKDAGFQPGGAGDFTEAESLSIPQPRCAFVNITATNGEAVWPQNKTSDFHYYIEFYDGAGNYFKKKIIFNAQGNSSLGFPKKNGAIDICNDDWEGDNTFSLRIGNWVPQDSFHLKAYYGDFTKGAPVICYHIADLLSETYGEFKNTTWKRAILPNYNFGDSVVNGDQIDNLSLQAYNDARCIPDGFPCIVYLNGDFYGIYAWQLKKHRDNYFMDKNKAEHIHLDGEINTLTLFNGTIDWTAFEIRNPKSLKLVDGSNYDGDNPQEITGDQSVDKNTAKVKGYITNLSNIRALIDAESDVNTKKGLIETYFDVENLIDYLLVNMIVADPDGYSKNWQWTTWDGIKWYLNQYDKDCSFGSQFTTTFTAPAFMTWVSGGVDVAESHTFPTQYIYTYYLSELRERYAQLRRTKVIIPEKIIAMFKDWMDRVGEGNYKKEFSKWDPPCNRDMILSNGWKLYTYTSLEEFRSIPSYESGRTYAAGEKCKIYGVAFEAISEVSEYPVIQWGYRDTFYRICNWINNRIILIDNYLQYSE